MWDGDTQRGTHNGGQVSSEARRAQGGFQQDWAAGVGTVAASDTWYPSALGVTCVLGGHASPWAHKTPPRISHS